MFPWYRNHSVDANQLTGFYMMGTLVVKTLKKTQKTSNCLGTSENEFQEIPCFAL